LLKNFYKGFIVFNSLFLGRKASWPESIAALDQPSQSCLKLYSQLKKAESLALF
jgi:hypothetical protein